MRQILLVAVIVLNVMLLKGCSKIDDDGQEKVFRSTAPQIMFDKILPILNDRDSEELKNLFSKNALAKTPEIDEQIADLMNFYKGKFVSNSHFDTGTGTGHQKEGIWVYMTISPVIQDFVTDEAVYTLRFYSVPVDYDNPDDVGLWRIWMELKDGDKVVDDCQVGANYQGRASH